MKLSVTIITLNEEANIGRAIKSAKFADEIIVVDSYSTDKTMQIAENLGAKVIQQKFLGFGQQKNHAASSAQGEWVLNIDADEEISNELKDNILSIINSDNPSSVYSFNRLTNYCGDWIKNGGWYPDWVARLYKKSQAKWTEPNVHEKLIANDQAIPGKISGELRHYSFPTISSQVKTNIKYAELAANDLLKKKNSIALPMLMIKPIGKFIECYFLKKGFLDGVSGFIIAVNAAHSMFMKVSIAYTKLKELNK